MLQLVQSPSPSLQRLIEIRCRKPAGKFESGRDADIAASVVHVEEPANSRVNSGTTNEGSLDETEPEVASLDQGKSSNEEPIVYERTERILDDRGDQILLSSSSYSNSRDKQHNNNVEADIGIDDEYNGNNNNDE